MVDRTDEERRHSWAMGLSMANKITMEEALTIVDEIDDERLVPQLGGVAPSPPSALPFLPG